MSAPPDLATRVGRRLREQRTALGLTLGEAAERAQISASHLSAIETGQKVPSLPILARVVAALDLSLHEVLRDVAAPMVHSGRLNLGVPGAEVVSHQDLLLRIAALVAEPGDEGVSPVPVAESEVFVYVRDGQLEVTVDGGSYELQAGDSLDTDPAQSISYRTQGDEQAVSIWASVRR